MIYQYDDENIQFRVFETVNEEHRRIVRLFRERDAEELTRFLLEQHWKAVREEAELPRAQ